MTTPKLTDAELAYLEHRASRASPDRYEVDTDDEGEPRSIVVAPDDPDNGTSVEVASCWDKDEAAFLAAAGNAVLSLVAEVRASRSPPPLAGDARTGGEDAFGKLLDELEDAVRDHERCRRDGSYVDAARAAVEAAHRAEVARLQAELGIEKLNRREEVERLTTERDAARMAEVAIREDADAAERALAEAREERDRLLREATEDRNKVATSRDRARDALRELAAKYATLARWNMHYAVKSRREHPRDAREGPFVWWPTGFARDLWRALRALAAPSGGDER